MGVTQPPLLSAAGPHARVGAPTATGFGVLSFSSAFLGPCGLETHLGSETHGQSRGLRPSRLGPLPWAVSPRPGLRSRPVWHRFRHRCGLSFLGPLLSACGQPHFCRGFQSLVSRLLCSEASPGQWRLTAAFHVPTDGQCARVRMCAHACICARARVHVRACACVTCPRTPSPACVLPSPFGLVSRTESSP